MDSLTPKARSLLMSKIKGKNTKPEMVVRKLLWSAGYRYRLHGKNLPGKPDVVFPSRRKAIFVHGCYWHGHRCRLGRMPKSRVEFWTNKIEGNRVRDGRTRKKLTRMGWKSTAVWECQLKNQAAVASRLARFLG